MTMRTQLMSKMLSTQSGTYKLLLRGLMLLQIL